MTRIIACVSGKGGVGKTTIVANAGAALAEMGKDVIAIDANLTTPNLGFHLGIPLYPITLHDVLKGRATIKEAIYPHNSGMKVIPAGISMRDLRGTDARDLPNTLLDLLGSSEIVLLDAAAGLGRETLAALEAADEMIVITNPNLPSVMDSLKARKLAEQMGTKIIGAIINRRRGTKHEITTEDISGMLDDIEILAEIPEDKTIDESIALRSPIIQHAPRSAASNELRRLSARLVGYNYSIPVPWHKKFLGFLSRNRS